VEESEVALGAGELAAAWERPEVSIKSEASATEVVQEMNLVGF
jgi:hypothetical protein